MPRITGVDLPPDKPTHISLRYLRGIGPTTALQVCEKLHIDPQRRAKDLSDDEIDQKARELSEEIFNLRFQLSMGVAKNPSRLREARRDLARARTIQRERQLAADSGGRR